MNKMIIVVVIVVLVAFTTLDLLPAVFVGETIRVAVSVLASGICILGYKIPSIGYGFKFFTSLIASNRVLLPVVTWGASNFFANEKLLVVQIVGVLVGATIITKWQINVTEFTFLHTESINFDHIHFLFMTSDISLNGLKNKFLKAKSNRTKNDRDSANNEKIYEEKINIQFQKLEEERKLIEEMKAQVERERMKLYENNKRVRIGFFDGCRNAEEIKIRYRKLVHEYHPDEERGNAEMFKKIQAEYECLN